MSHEIYYTSAPEGLKRGASGFCTVAATENIPRALWDRLEALSAYRHHFPASAGGQNPVSHAHWLLNVAGTTYHVLSRICDSGVDHTQRTNAFAHHVVVESSEMAAGGPAWMLERAGVMAASWDGRVGSLPGPRALPRGDRAAGICHAWQQAAGDAGWGGHLADVFVKTPAKPVCILFGPGQNVLPLIEEAIALLPPMARWNVTFNTYFTSMPTSATCAWRCCLAGTPAAQVALRYAANGIVIDLTEKAHLGQPPAGPYVTMARSGQAPAGVARTSAAAPAVRPAAAVIAVRSAPTEAVAVPPELPSAPPPAEAPLDEEGFGGAPAEVQPMPLESALPRGQRRSAVAPMPNMRAADAALRRIEEEAAQAAGRRRHQIMMLFFGAMAAIAVAMTLMYLGFRLRNNLPPETPRTVTPRSIDPVAPTVGTMPAPNVAPPAPIAPAPPAPAAVNVAPTPITPVPPSPAPPAREYPAVLSFARALERPAVGAGLSDSVQSLPYPRNDLRNPDHIESIYLLFPKPAASIGTFTGATDRYENKPAYFVRWRAASPMAKEPGDDVFFLVLDARRSQVDIHWKTGMFIRQGEAATMAWWMLQSAELVVGQTGVATSQKIAFKPYEPAPLALSDAAATINWPIEPPKTAIPSAVNLPPEWTASVYTEADPKENVLRKPEAASQVLKFERRNSSQGWFTITFRSGFGKIENTFAKRLAADEAELANAESDLRAITADIRRIQAESGVKEGDPRLTPYQLKKDEITRLATGYKEAVTGYKELKVIDISLDTPEKLHLTTLHFRGEK